MLLNNIYNTDCIEFMKTLSDCSVDLIVTDPPYLMNFKSRTKNKESKFAKEILNDDVKSKNLIIDYIKECYRVLKDNTACYMFCNANHIEFFKTELSKYFNIKNIIVWVKNNHTCGDCLAAYGKQYEFIIYCNKGRCPIRGKRIRDVWFFDKVAGKKQLHQNQKPLDLIEQCIVKSSDEGGGRV